MQGVLSDEIIEKYNMQGKYYGSIKIGSKLKKGEWDIVSNMLYLSKDDFDKNNISEEAINDFLVSVYAKEAENEAERKMLNQAKWYAYEYKIPLSEAKKEAKKELEYLKEPLYKEAKEKFRDFEPSKIKDLLEWHNGSSELTKDEQGLPKVFYHGSTSGKKISVFENEFDKSGWGFWFSPLRELGLSFAKNNKPQAVFLKLKKPFDMTKGVDFDLMQRENLFFEKEQIEQMKDEFLRIRGIYKGLIDDLSKQGIKPIEFFSSGDFWGLKNGKLRYFNNDDEDFRWAHKTKKAVKFEESKNYKAFRIWQKTNDIAGVRNEYDLLFRMAKVGDYVDNKVKSDLSALGYDGIRVSENEFTIFDSAQAKAVDNKGAYTDDFDVWEKPSKREIKENELKHKYFNESSPNIYQSNAHIGSGLLSGSIAGVEQDEEGNYSFNAEKFVLGLLGGALTSKAISSGYKRFLQNKPHKIIPLINKQKYTKPRFEITAELEKTYRNAQVKPNEKIKDTLKLSGVVKGDFIKLAQKHPEYFANPQEAKTLCEYVFNNAFIGLQASDKNQALIIAKLQDSNNDYGSVAFRVQNINGEHRIRSVILMEQKQVDLKIQKAKKLGEPIFHFW